MSAAKRLAKALVRERVCACANIVPGLRSIYRWQGRVRDEAEVLVILKTSAAKAPLLRARLPELHPYEVPELIVWSAAVAVPAYARWLTDSTS